MKRTVDTEAYLTMLERLLAAAHRRVGQSDVDELRVLARLSRSIEDLQTEAVRRLRAESVTWDDIGTATGVTRQAALMKWKPRLSTRSPSAIATTS
jgi:hypothetical protein